MSILCTCDEERGHTYRFSAPPKNWKLPPGFILKMDRYPTAVEVVRLAQPTAAPAWSGPEDGLPPVGFEVEVHDDHPHKTYAAHCGHKVRIVAHDVIGEGDDEGTPIDVYHYDIKSGTGYHALVACKFRPIKTHEQIAAEEREKAVAKLAAVIRDSGWESPEILAAYLDSHGYCKFEIVDEQP